MKVAGAAGAAGTTRLVGTLGREPTKNADPEPKLVLETVGLVDCLLIG